jgi:DNA polymerase-1
MSAKPVILVDGSSYLYRAFHALPPLSNASGQATGAIHGVLNMLLKLVDEYEPDRLAVVFDASGKTFRNELYAEYKATRERMPDELRSQIEPVIEAIEAMGIPVLRIAGVEADDVIGTLAVQTCDSGLKTVISTGDKDMTQLVNERIEVVNTMTDTRLDSDGVKEKFGVRPDQIVDYLTLVGDTSDNIPGVPGVGPKTAVKWLEQYGSLSEIEAHSDDIGGKVGERLRAALPDLPLYKNLVTIRCDVSLEGTTELTRHAPDTAKLREIYERLELRSLLRRLAPDEAAAGANPGTEQTPCAPLEAKNYTTILSDAELDEWLEKINAAELVALDTETTSLRYMEAELVGISFAVGKGEAAYLPLAHDYPGAPEQLDRTAVLARLRPWLESNEHAKVGHHLKYDAHIFRNYGIQLGGIEHDTMLESYVLDSTATRHDMDSVAQRYLGIQTVKYEDVAGKGAKQLRFNEIDLETAAKYAAEDADVSLQIHAALWPQLQALPKLAKLYTELERPLLEVLRKMEYAGVMVDAKMLARQSQELAETMLAVERAAYEAGGGPFNLGSPKQLQEVLYDRLGLPVLGKTPKGQPSTAENVLQDLAEDYDLPRLILEYRGLSKLKSTYTDKLPREINPATGRIHTSYHQAVAATGRLSSSEPNLQNIPIRTQEGRRIRQAFVAAPGYRLIAADYSQIELRIMAHLSGDAGLLQAFRDELDIHSATAAEVFGLDPDAVSVEQRRSAKAINFGLIYGMSAFGLARQLGIDRGQAQSYIDLYFERYPGVHRYMEETREIAREQGYVETVFGRRLYLPEIKARNAQRRQYAERSAINAPMQGTAADIIKRAMLLVDAWLTQDEVDGRLIMQVHDELVAEVAESEVDFARQKMSELMQSAANLSVPLLVATGTGLNWDQAH